MKSIIISLVFSTTVVAQFNLLKSSDYIKLFADHLYCEQDYLRAAEEYESLFNLNSLISDTIIFKIGQSYSKIGRQDKALEYFSMINQLSAFSEYAKNEIGKIFFQRKDESALDKLITDNIHQRDNFIKLKIALKLESNNLDYNWNEYLTENDSDYIELNKFYSERKNPDYKSEALAGIFSAVIPGSGKIYTEEYSDGITAFILTGLFSYLAYDNFRHNHHFRAYIFSGIAAGFYLGNIYGSVASAQIFNARIDFNFLKSLSDFLIQKNYFTKEYDFCK